MPSATIIPAVETTRVREVASRAAAVLRDGGLVVFPTETVYGIAASAAHPQAYARLQQIKQRFVGQPFAVHISRAADGWRYLDDSVPLLRRCLPKLMPGPITLVVKVPETVIEQRMQALGYDDAMRRRLYQDDTIALRCPDDPLAGAILSMVDQPVVGAGASLPGQPAARDADAAAALAEHVDLIIDGGRCRYARPSTLVRLQTRGNRATIVVEPGGVLDERFVRKLMRWNLLFVCSGNTCRSPMASAMARRMIAEQIGVDESDLEKAGIQVRSAGTSAANGEPATSDAVAVMRQQGIDIRPHRSQMLSSELINMSDQIICMTDSHAEAVRAIMPAAASKVELLDPEGGIADPFGAGMDVYQACASRMRDLLAAKLKEQFA
jgi:protein-tyrosine phosphatase